MYNNTIKALEIIFNKEFDPANPFAALREFVPSGQLITADVNETFICQKETAQYIYILIQGQAAILNCIDWNNDNVVDYVKALDVLGLVEVLNNVDSYTAYVTAETKCYLLRIPAKEFIRIIQENAFLCFHTLKVVETVLESNMNTAEIYSQFHHKDILGHYLYLQARHKLPYICPFTRKELSEKLHINLRTLYRYIDSIRDNEMLTLKRGKIIIEPAHMQKLSERYGNVIL